MEIWSIYEITLPKKVVRDVAEIRQWRTLAKQWFIFAQPFNQIAPSECDRKKLLKTPPLPAVPFKENDILPIEIWERIFGYLDENDAASLVVAVGKVVHCLYGNSLGYCTLKLDPMRNPANTPYLIDNEVFWNMIIDNPRYYRVAYENAEKLGQLERYVLFGCISHGSFELWKNSEITHHTGICDCDWCTDYLQDKYEEERSLMNFCDELA